MGRTISAFMLSHEEFRGIFGRHTSGAILILWIMAFYGRLKPVLMLGDAQMQPGNGGQFHRAWR
jgi:hypothetical protein